MDETIWILHAAVLGAALLQAATGIGFGVIAGPIILLAMNSGAAVQVTILLSLLIAALLVPTLYKKADKAFLWRILAGSVLGLPLGIAVFLLVSVDTLKLLAGFAVLTLVGMAALMYLHGPGLTNPAMYHTDLTQSPHWHYFLSSLVRRRHLHRQMNKKGHQITKRRMISTRICWRSLLA